MGELERTRLEQTLRQRHLTLDEFRKEYQEASGSELSARQAYRWVAGDITRLPYPHAQAALERMFGESASRLFGPPYGSGSITQRQRLSLPTVAGRGRVRNDWEGQLITMSADRARDFLAKAESSNVGGETIDQLSDDVRRLTEAYQQQPLTGLLPDMAETQDRAFGLLEGRQKPGQTRDLYLLAGVTSGLMAKASHDLGAAHDALTQARAAYACADNAGHDGLRAWIRGLQALITYWSGRFDDSVRYARLGREAAEHSRGTAAVWLASGEARSLAALGKLEEAHAALNVATDARMRVQHDELDQLGGLCTFNEPRQLYYAADALIWGGAAEAEQSERMANDALLAYDRAAPIDRAFSDEAGTRCDLAVARVYRGELEGAAEAIEPVLALPTDQRIHGIITSVERVGMALREIEKPDPKVRELGDALASFTTERLALPR